MHLAIFFALLLTTLSACNAQNLSDRQILAEIKQIAEQTKHQMIQLALRYEIEIIESIEQTGIVDQAIIRRLQPFKFKLLEKLRKPLLKDADFENDFDELLAILGLDNETEERGLDLLARYTNNTLDRLLHSYREQIKKETQIFVYITSPKMRKLSLNTQEKEQELVTAFNNVAYAGLVSMEKQFGKFLRLIEKF